MGKIFFIGTCLRNELEKAIKATGMI
jgi:hypothetical protein